MIVYVSICSYVYEINSNEHAKQSKHIYVTGLSFKEIMLNLLLT